MTSAEFLQQLAANLQCLQEEERANAMAYYREYFEEAGDENETEAVEHLGSPQSVAERIIKEVGDGRTSESGGASSVQYTAPPAYQYDGAAAKTASDNIGRIIFAIIVILLTSPFWIAVPIVWFTIVFLLVFLPLVFAFAGIVAPIQGIIGMVAGDMSGGLYELGGGIFLIGFTMLVWYPCFKLAWLLTKLFGKMCVGIWGLLAGKEKKV